MSNLEFRILDESSIKDILPLAQQLNEKISVENLEERQSKMFQFDNYICFGLYENETLVGISSGWITIKFYSGKQLEVDNFVIDNAKRSNGLGKQFVKFIEEWAVVNECRTLELNSYVGNTRSHIFYERHGYFPLGYHFQKHMVLPS
ncbi:MAG: GNAT family N-acetyltransferase [Flavobacteriales bacterium]|nr:GNAT family N-acetyltransferase [Flavobacteriales bacterium]